MRLTAHDGYAASRSYSVASPPDGTTDIELTVERLDDGEVSTVLHDALLPGDDLAPSLLPDAVSYVCGWSGFADAVSELLVALGVPVDRIPVERFGPT